MKFLNYYKGLRINTLGVIAMLCVSILSFFIGFKITGDSKQVGIVTPSENNPVENEVMVAFGKNEVVIKQESVVINEGFEIVNPLAVTIDKMNYPDLFLPEDKFARLHVEEISGNDKLGIKLLRIARQIPDHGSLADSYFVIVDPEIGKVVYTGWEHLFCTVRLYSSCMNCSLPLIEFREYDQKKQSYILVNNKHKKEFIELQQQHEQLGKKEKCRINGKDMTIDEAVRTAKNDDKCADSMMGISNNNPSNNFITVGQYRVILSNIERVIRGENIELFDRI